jgi:hypothetical protein
MSSSWRLKFWGGSQFFGRLVYPLHIGKAYHKAGSSSRLKMEAAGPSETSIHFWKLDITRSLNIAVIIILYNTVDINMHPAEEMLGCDFNFFIDIISTPISKNLNVSVLQNIYAQSMQGLSRHVPKTVECYKCSYGFALFSKRLLYLYTYKRTV